MKPPAHLNRYERMRWQAAHNLARMSEEKNGIGAIAATHFIANPTRTCTACAGKGANWTSDPKGSCGACRGLGYIVMTVSEIRDEYKMIRARVCDERVTNDTHAAFDAEATAIVAKGGEHGPGFWLAAARQIETQDARARAERRKKVRFG